jgi:hypothetical protein
VDEHDTHVRRVVAVHEAGGDHRARADADVHVEVREVEALERLADRVQRAHFVERAERPAAGERQSEPVPARRGLLDRGLQVEHGLNLPRPSAGGTPGLGLALAFARARPGRDDLADSALTLSFSSATRLVSRRISLAFGTPICCSAFWTRLWNRRLEVVPGFGGLFAGRADARLHRALGGREHVPDHLLGRRARPGQQLQPLGHGFLECGRAFLLCPCDGTHAGQPDVLDVLDGAGLCLAGPGCEPCGPSISLCWFFCAQP